MSAVMSLRAVVLGKTLLVRQPIAQSLSALDFQVHESSDLAEVVSTLNLTAPALIVMDADGLAREWRMLAAGLGAKRGAAALVLLTSRCSFEDVHEAMALRVAGVIVKPFRRDEHTARLLDLALRPVDVKARRSAPRFALPESTHAVLRWSLSESEYLLPVKNVAEGGAMVRVEADSPEAAFKPGGFIPLATLSWGEVQLEVAFDVIHRGTDAAGIRFSRIFDGTPKLLRALEELQVRALGPRGKKRKW
jgi:CheY-like chemotaxis protein